MPYAVFAHGVVPGLPLGPDAILVLVLCALSLHRCDVRVRVFVDVSDDGRGPGWTFRFLRL